MEGVPNWEGESTEARLENQPALHMTWSQNNADPSDRVHHLVRINQNIESGLQSKLSPSFTPFFITRSQRH